MSVPAHSRHPLSAGAFVAILGVLVAGLVLVEFYRERSVRRIPQPVISEFQAGNVNGLRDETGRPADWIELWNPSNEIIDLTGWSLTDDYRHLHKWTFPAVTLAPRQFLVVFATGKSRTQPGAPLHTNFRLDPRGKYLALVAPGGEHVVQEFLPKYPRQIPDTSFGLTPDAFERDPRKGSGVVLSELAYLQTPTPGARNTDELLGIVQDLKLNHHRGTFREPFKLLIATKTFDAAIRYTVDGSPPTSSHGIVYRGAIDIGRTTTLRAAAFRPGYKASEIVTETFVFPADVVRQSNEGHPSTWGVRNDKPVSAAYAMSTNILNSDMARSAAEVGLAALPSVALTLAPEDLFGATQGLYTHPLEHGVSWERPASFEWWQSGGHANLQTECGVRIQGGWSRRPEESPKHSFRVVFRAEYEGAALKHRFFGVGGPKAYHELILRAGCNNSWLHWSAAERRRGELLRDQWMRDTLSAMGTPSPRGTFVHLYLNGIYWGIYNLTERPDANFLAEWFGGNPKDYDSRNADNILSGDTVVWDRLFVLANAGVATEDAYAQVSELLDIPSFIDFMIVHLYGGSGDIDSASNWYAARRRRSGGRYIFIMWDGERSLEGADVNALGLDDDQCPTRLFQKLRENAAFRQAFSNRIKELTAPAGWLSPENTSARYRALADSVSKAMICESARWGYYRRDVHPYKEGPYELYTVEGFWQPEVSRLLNEYFPRRTGVLLEQLRAAGLLTP